jgi:hypothetical protein
MHRFSPYSTRAIKGRKNGVKKNKQNKHIHNKENTLVDNLLELGYSYERAIGCLSYIENKTIEEALNFFEFIEPLLCN